MPTASWPARPRESASAPAASRCGSALPRLPEGVRLPRLAVHPAVGRRRDPGGADRRGNRARDAHELLRRVAAARRVGRADGRRLPRGHPDHHRDLHLRAALDRGGPAAVGGSGLRGRVRGVHAAVRRRGARGARDRPRFPGAVHSGRLPRGALVLRAAGRGDRGRRGARPHSAARRRSSRASGGAPSASSCWRTSRSRSPASCCWRRSAPSRRARTRQCGRSWGRSSRPR